MGNKLQVFENDQFGEIRTIMIDGEPWFVGKDVASVLGYKDTVSALKTHVDDEDKRGWRITTPSGEQVATIINESGLYSLIFGSKLDSAKGFKRWVTSDVLPTLRKTGSYNVEQLTAPAKPTMAMVKEMELRFKVMDRMGCTPYEIAGMMTSMDMAYGVAVSRIMADKVDPQMCLFDAPALPADAALIPA